MTQGFHDSGRQIATEVGADMAFYPPTIEMMRVIATSNGAIR